MDAATRTVAVNGAPPFPPAAAPSDPFARLGSGADSAGPAAASVPLSTKAESTCRARPLLSAMLLRGRGLCVTAVEPSCMPPHASALILPRALTVAISSIF